ncbi:Hypp1146 [Branchiostoma lanceolatum]|uniref:Hypp1146 protein n=1 Tax=Branchiostoma lanceolatum TaxID=7740 RepID=A0A8K0EHG2_BRALA|nr:Hypp1146 [Branchiostoma lanceolatum]
MTWNPIASFIRVEELEHVSRLVLARNGILCDCRLRGMKAWMLRNNNHFPWSVTCADPSTGLPKRLRWLHMNDLKCASNVTGGFAVARQEALRACYSGLHTPALGYGMGGTHTCPGTSDNSNDVTVSTGALTVARFPSELKTTTSETSSRTDTYTYTYTYKYTYTYTSQPQTTVWGATTPVGTKETTTRPGLSVIQLVLVGLAPFVGCSVIAGVVAACVSKCKGVRQHDNANGQRKAEDKHYENDDQFSDTDSVRVATYENDDQCSDTDGGRVHYENDDQFSDTEGANGVHYENDDEFSDTDREIENHYENDDQFSDDGNPESAIPHKLTNEKLSLAEAENSRRRLIQRRLAKKRSGRYRAKSGLLTILEDAHAEAQASGHYDNDKSNVELSNREAATSRRFQAKSKVLTILAEVHAQAHASGHYDNDKNAVGLSSREATESLDNVASDDGGHYHNERPVTNSVTTASETTKRTDDESESDQDYMTLPNFSAEDIGVGEEGNQSESRAKDRSTSSTSSYADDVPDNDYVTFVGNENTDRKIRKKGGHVADVDVNTAVLNADDNSDHTFVTFPETESQNGQVSDLDAVVSPVEDNSDHTFVTFPETECQNGQVSDLATVVSPVEDNSDHTFVTFPETVKTDKCQI